MKNFLAHNDEIRAEMLADIGFNNIEDLFSQIPKAVRMQTLDLPEALSEMKTQKCIKSLAKENNADYINFMGGGMYNHFIPACINNIAQRVEFLTAYTPYQPEISQGTLQIIYEYQTMICNLTGQDVSNAGLYDGASACAEAILMACRYTAKNKALISKNLNPEYINTIKTYLWAGDIEFDFFENIKDKNLDEYACVLYQTPNYNGELEDFSDLKLSDKTLLIACCNITSLSILNPPNADITVGDVQTLGIPMSFGGPSAGYMACREKFMRQMPGRIVGMTLDADGKEAFTLTLQTREQHIRRQKATSNICSNQSLISLCATVYLSLLGKKGFKQVGIISHQRAVTLSEKLANKGIKTLNKNFFNEFVIQVKNADEFLAKLKAKNILGGIKLSDDKILVATTEMIDEEDIQKYVEAV